MRIGSGVGWVAVVSLPETASMALRRAFASGSAKEVRAVLRPSAFMILTWHSGLFCASVARTAKARHLSEACVLPTVAMIGSKPPTLGKSVCVVWGRR